MDHRIIIKGQLLVLHVFLYVSPREGPGPAAGIHWFSIGFPRLAARQSHFARDRESRCREARAEAICLGAHGGTETRFRNTQRTVHVGHWFVMVCPVMVCPRECKYMV